MRIMQSFFEIRKLSPEAKPISVQEVTSDLMKEIIKSASTVSEKGTVAKEDLLTFNDLSQVEMVSGSQNIYDLIIREIKKAKKQVLIQTFVWVKDTQVVRDIKSALASLKDEVEVFVFVDQLKPLARTLFIREFPPKKPAHDPASLGLEGLPKNIKLHIGVYTHNSLASNHAKAILIDGSTLILTGANFQPNNYGPNPFQDAAMLIKGDIAKSAFDDFKAMWNIRKNKSEEKNAVPKFHQEIIREAKEGKEVKVSKEFEDHKVIIVPKEVQESKDAPEPKELKDFMEVSSKDKIERKLVKSPVLYVTNNIRKRLAVLPAYKKTLPPDPVNYAIISAIKNAKKIIRIAVPNLNAPEVVAELIAFINRGGKLELILSKNFNDFREKRYGGTNAKIVDKLIAGVNADKQDNLQIRWFRREGQDLDHAKDVLHMKFFTFDDQVLIYGSANLDMVSLYNSHEAGMVIDNGEFTLKATKTLFENYFLHGKNVREELEEAPYQMSRLA